MRGDLNRFPVLAERHFFNHAAVAPIPAVTREVILRYADLAAHQPAAGETYQAAKTMKERAATLLGADPDEIAAIPNTSTGLALVARGLDWSRGGTVVTTSLEFPANRYPWQDLTRLGVGLSCVQPRDDGRIHLDDLVSAMREGFRKDQPNVLAISHVQFGAGQRLPLADLVAAAHDHGGLLCLDAIQSVGAIPIDVHATGVDYLSADGHKWMLGPEGAGIFYARRDRLEELHPLVAGWLCMNNPFEFGDYCFEFRPDAARFEPGCWNVVGMMGLSASLDLLLEAGAINIWSGLQDLTERLREGLPQLGVRPFPDLPPDERSGIVSFAPQETDADPTTIVERLRRLRVEVAAREGRVRISPHFYNTPEQIAHLLEVLRSALRK